MQKLRDLYKETQRNANDDFDKVTHERMKKVLAYASKQTDNCVARNDFQNLEEITFYRQKFKAIVDTFNDSIQQGYKKSKIQTQIKSILKENFLPQRVNSLPQHVRDAEKSDRRGQEFNIPKAVQSQPPKDIIQSYFQNKNMEISKSKIGFKSVLEGIPYVPKKFAIKHQQQQKVSGSIPSNNSEQIKALMNQIDRLKKQLKEKDVQKDFNMEILQIEKKEYQDRIQDLCKQVETLHSQNDRLKEQSMKNYPIQSYPYTPAIYEQEKIKQTDDYNPYRIRYRQNDINKIQNKHTKDIVTVKYTAPLSPKTYNHPVITQQYDESKLKSQNLELINQLERNVDESKRKQSQDVLNTSFYKFNKSGTKNDAKTIALKSKLSFFKSSMIIYRGQDFEIAVKSAQIIPLQAKKISIYIYNKLSIPRQVNIEYKFDTSYYELKVNKKVSKVDRNSQGKEEVSVKLINSTDLDSLIQAKLTVDSKEVIFLLPAIFLEFLEKRPIFEKTVDYAVHKVNPIAQFATLHSTAQYIPMEKLYGEHYESGRAYAISKNHEGYIYFRWQNGQIQIETIPAWRLFLSYLMLKEY